MTELFFWFDIRGLILVPRVYTLSKLMTDSLVSCEVKFQESRVRGLSIKSLPRCRLNASKLENDMLFLR